MTTEPDSTTRRFLTLIRCVIVSLLCLSSSWLGSFAVQAAESQIRQQRAKKNNHEKQFDDKQKQKKDRPSLPPWLQQPSRRPIASEPTENPSTEAFHPTDHPTGKLIADWIRPTPMPSRRPIPPAPTAAVTPGPPTVFPTMKTTGGPTVLSITTAPSIKVETLVILLSELIFRFRLAANSDPPPSQEVLGKVFIKFIEGLFPARNGIFVFESPQIKYTAANGRTKVALQVNWTGDAMGAPSRASWERKWQSPSTLEDLMETLNDSGFPAEALTVQIEGSSTDGGGSVVVDASQSPDSSSDGRRGSRHGLAGHFGPVILSFAVVFILLPWGVVISFVAKKRILARDDKDEAVRNGNEASNGDAANEAVELLR